MSVFDDIRDAIFGRHGQPQQLDQAQRRAMPQLGEPGSRPVDVEQVLAELHRDRSEPDLHWRSSAADLMTLLGVDSSADSRAALARELGHSGTFEDTPEMNLWLYRRVMQELEASGGRVAASLKH